MNANKVIGCALNFRNSPNKVIEGPIIVERSKRCNWSIDNFIEVNFSK